MGQSRTWNSTDGGSGSRAPEIIVLTMTCVVIACIDVHYLDSGGARAAIVSFPTFDAAVSSEERVVSLAHVEPYESGAFYKRELPCLVAALDTLAQFPKVVILDGLVWLEAPGGRPGLGARLLDAEPRLQTVIGVTKTRFVGASAALVLRGSSEKPLWVDEAGMPLEEGDAPRAIVAMHGPHRVPTMLRLVDQLCRGHVMPHG